MNPIRWPNFGLATAVLWCALALACSRHPETATGPPALAGQPAAKSATAVLRDLEVQQLGRVVAALLSNRPLPDESPRLLETDGVLAYVALRRDGVKLADAWGQGLNGLGSLQAALLAAKKATPGQARPNTVELVLAHSFTRVSHRDRKRLLANIHRGVWGLEIRYRQTVVRYGPTQMIAENRGFERLIDRFAERLGLSEEAVAREVRLRRFKSGAILVYLAQPTKAVRLFRGNQLVRVEDVTRGQIAALAQRMGDWMIRNVHDDGRMTYKYWPSRGRESEANNMIRQWMASLCLVRLAHRRGDSQLADLVVRNLRYNLNRFYHEEADLGMIEFRSKVKLGAIALAALAIAEHPGRGPMVRQERALRRTIRHLWRRNGSFQTFLRPVERDDNQNFYPGEALLYLVRVYRETRDPDLLAWIMRSFRTYRAWHLQHRNPAFVPWHTMAYAELWGETKDPALASWIFEMNDWLLTIQQSAPREYPDIDGRFYDPNRRHFGPPHASTTGIYLEGLVQAYRVARELGESKRAEAYRQAIVRGLRSVLQLEFNDPIDMYYVSQRTRVRGALRTTVYNNEIRVDNVQHNLMALFGILDTFEEKDFRL
jgi:hypothetical protein